MTERRGRRGFIVYSLLLIFTTGIGYYATLLQGIGAAGDTMKFQYIGKVLGIPHPTGYPLYVTLNHLFVTSFPFGSVALRANLLSTLFAVAACWYLFRLLLLLNIQPWLGFVSSLLFAFSYTFWKHAVIAEVYTLFALFMIAVCFYLLRWHLERRDRDFYVATALYAFSFGNHLLAITLVPALVYLVLVTDKTVFLNGTKVIWVLLVIVLGASQYLFLFWRFFDRTTPFNEGFGGRNFFHFVTGAYFKKRMFVFSPAEIVLERIPLFLQKLNRDMPLFALVSVFGIYPFKHFTRVKVFLLIYFVTNALYAINYDIPDIDAYFLPNAAIATVFLALVFQRLHNWFKVRTPRASRWLVVGLLVLPCGYYFSRYNALDFRRGDVERRREVETILHYLEEDAVVFPLNYGSGQAFLYYLLVEGWREKGLFVVPAPFNRLKLHGYMVAGDPLISYIRNKFEPVPAGLPVYVYPCEGPVFPNLSIEVRPVRDVPYLCRLTPKRFPKNILP